MARYDDELEHRRYRRKRRDADRRLLILLITVVVLLVISVSVLVIMLRRDRATLGGDAADAQMMQTEQQETEDGLSDTEQMPSDGGTGENADDPQNQTAGSMSTETGADINVEDILSAGNVAETEGVTYGIDVAKYQGTIDWKQVADAGIDFAMVRVGYRVWSTGEICEDTNAKYNMQEAQANGIKVGAYFFSSAVNEEEAKEEADWAADYISQYRITYPVAYNCEGFERQDSRQYNLTQTERTNVAMAFLNRIYERGYTPMFYAAKNELEADAKWDTSRLEQKYKIWLAWYPSYVDPSAVSSEEYATDYAMWQYSNQGKVAGISYPVDVNVAYFGYEGTADAQNTEAPDLVDADVEALMNFTEVNETVTAKEKTNLRDIPSQDDDSTVVTTLANGETAVRTGVSDSGWSRVEYNGATYYAVSSYLTTDLSYQPAGDEGAGSGDGLKTKFTEMNDTVTAKIEVNLRALPSVTNPDATIIAVLRNGETVTRTGINHEYGWSRVEYNGQTLYCISSYLTGAQ